MGQVVQHLARQDHVHGARPDRQRAAVGHQHRESGRVRFVRGGAAQLDSHGAERHAVAPGRQDGGASNVARTGAHVEQRPGLLLPVSRFPLPPFEQRLELADHGMRSPEQGIEARDVPQRVPHRRRIGVRVVEQLDPDHPAARLA